MGSTSPRCRPGTRRALRALLLAGAGVCGGCGYSAPQVSVATASATERTPDGLAMVFEMDARNDNDASLPLRTAEYRVEINGRRVFTGTRSAEATLRRLGTQRFRLPAVIDLASEPTDLEGPARFRVSGTLLYVTPGQLAEVLFDAGVHVPSVEFAGEGTIDLSAARRVTPTISEPLEPGRRSDEPRPAP